MHKAILLTVLAIAPATALAGPAQQTRLKPSITVGAHAGGIYIDKLDVINSSWYAAPRLGFYFIPQAGLELDVGFSTGRAYARAGFDSGHKFFAVLPQLTFIGDPLATNTKAVVKPLFEVGFGAFYKAIGQAGTAGAIYADKRVEALITVGAGLKIPVVGPLSVRLDARAAISVARENDTFISPYVDFIGTGGLDVNFSIAKDTDKDGVPDVDDQCPDEPEDHDGFEDDDGCPEYDNDGDGIPDTDDQCPNDPEDLDGFEDGDGCPDPDNDGDLIPDVEDECPNDFGTMALHGCPDSDFDGIPDKDDACPDLAGPAEFDGCPDTDGDGLADNVDACPTEAGPEATQGCPDRDGDGVADKDDACPDEKINEGADPAKSDGCPSKVFITQDAVVIVDQVQFDNGRSTIRSASFDLLNNIADVLNKYLEITRVQVEGHTDNVGRESSNLTLSQARAEAVVKYLVDHGVAAERLIPRGFGPTRPIAPNTTADGRAKNRRVEFNILEQRKRVVEVRADQVPAEEAPEADEPEDSEAGE